MEDSQSYFQRRQDLTVKAMLDETELLGMHRNYIKSRAVLDPVPI